MFTSSKGNFIHVTANTLVSVVVIFNDFFCFLPGDADALRQTPWFNRVSNSKVDNLRKSPCFFEFFVCSGPEYKACSARVNVVAFLKRLQHNCILSYMSQQSEFEL